MDHPRPDRRRVLMALAWSCVVAALAMLAVLTQQVERTSDEVNYLLAGRTLVERRPLATVEQRFQGPLMLMATQLADPGEDAEQPSTLRRARLGMLMFPALLLTILVLWSRAVLGEQAALWTAFLAATNPTLLAYGPLLSSDVPFTAMAVTAGWLSWRWLRSSRLRDLLLVGVALGGLAATKYTALLTVAGLMVVVGIAVLAGFDAMPPRFGGRTRRLPMRVVWVAAAFGVAGTVALGTLYACYLFASPPFPSSSAAALTYGPLHLLASVPLGPQLLGLLPEPLVLGIDYQAVIAGQKGNGTFLDLVGNHWAYYPLSLLTKTPVATLGLALLGLVGMLRRERVARYFWSCVLVPPFVLLAYCSATRALQMGVRYMLPVVPALLLLAGSWTRLPWFRSRLGRALAALVVLSSLVTVVSGWPSFIGYFNDVAGGSQGGYRVCFDGNCDWMQRRQTGPVALRARHAQVTFLLPGEGPRFGQLAAYTADLKSRDLEDATHTYHWLTRFEPIDHDFAAWLVFDVTPAAFEACIRAGDHRAAHDLAIAWLRRGDFEQARQALAKGAGGDARDDARARTVGELIDGMQAVAQGDGSQRDVLVDRLQRAGHADLALQLFVDPPRRDAIRVFLLMLGCGRVGAAVDMMERVAADGSRTADEAFLLATVVYEGAGDFAADPGRAQRLLELGPAPPPDSPLQAAWSTLQQKIRNAQSWIQTAHEKR